jgi:hypothetical protein
MRLSIATGATAAALLCATAASAGPYADSLDKCLVGASTEADKADLAKWVFAGMAADPAVKDMASVTPAQRHALDARAAAVAERLIMTDCRKQAVAALQNEGAGVLGQAFAVLGQVATRELTGDPAAKAALATFASFLDDSKWIGLAAAAGLPPSALRAR